jgi:hypothetical protein
VKGHKHTISIFLAVLFTFGSFAVAGEPLPEGWMGGNTKDYDIGVDREIVKEGKASAYIRSKTPTPENFGTIVQAFSAKEYVGKRVRMSAFVKADKIEEWAGLWMRIDGEGKENRSLSFDNMQSRPIKGTLDWKEYEIVLDVPNQSKSITFGILLTGPGQAWLDDFKFAVVTKDVPVTGQTRQGPSEGPTGLGFEN